MNDLNMAQILIQKIEFYSLCSGLFQPEIFFLEAMFILIRLDQVRNSIFFLR